MCSLFLLQCFHSKDKFGRFAKLFTFPLLSAQSHQPCLFSSQYVGLWMSFFKSVTWKVNKILVFYPILAQKLNHSFSQNIGSKKKQSISVICRSWLFSFLENKISLIIEQIQNLVVFMFSPLTGWAWLNNNKIHKIKNVIYKVWNLQSNSSENFFVLSLDLKSAPILLGVNHFTQCYATAFCNILQHISCSLPHIAYSNCGDSLHLAHSFTSSLKCIEIP